jgi:para-aminobenzoate synthetase/4-amino-4-deoxychorismate lyase
MTGRASPQPYVLLEDIASPKDRLAKDGIGAGFPRRLYKDPVQVITARTMQDIAPAIEAMDEALDAGFHLAGWIGYEAGYALEARLAPLAPPPGDIPLIWMGVFEGYERANQAPGSPIEQSPRFPAAEYLAIEALESGLDEAGFKDALNRIHDYLLAGDVYQINFTFPIHFTLKGTARALYRRLRMAQPVGFGALIETGAETIISLSPELFLDKDGDRIMARPMKGTAARGRTLEEDDRIAESLAQDPKSRAENLMIVDLLRNDLSRVAENGSVDVPALFEVERYRTVLQMTSTVQARVQRDLPIRDILRGLFPCGSVTGAPKIRAMEIIRELEAEPRGPYTGAIGCITPDRDFTFSVPIRTMTLSPSSAAPRLYTGKLGVGAGIVADSDIDAEFDECWIKGRFLTAPQPDFDLIETFGWSLDNGYTHLDGHIARLEASARFFGFQIDGASIRENLDSLAGSLKQDRPYRVRLVLGRSGNFTLTASAIETPAEGPRTVTLSHVAVNSADPLLYHKTTVRGIYERGLAEARARTGCFEALFLNEKGQLTEGSFTNLFIERDGRLLTPPVTAGLLPGILRDHLITTGQAEEILLYPEDLETADRIFVGNSLRGLMEARLTISA